MKKGLLVAGLVILGMCPVHLLYGDVSQDQIKRLTLQHHLDYRAPLYNATFIGTHNSYNATEDGYNLVDPTLANHTASLTRQMNAGARVLSFDLTDPPFDGTNKIYQCHQACGIGDKELSYGVGKVKDWLAIPANADEVIIIVIEESIGFDNADRTKSAEYFNVTGFGDKVYRPQDYSGADTGIRELPLQDLTKQKIRDAGKNILLVCEDCNGPNSWDNMVWNLPVTESVGRTQYNWSVVAEDRTSLPSNNEISGSTFRSNLEQGAGLLGLDYMVSVNRHDSLIWSWNPDEPNNSGGNEDCAVQLSSGQWNDRDCADTFRFACQNVQTGAWRVPTTTGPWSSGDTVCGGIPGGNHIFSVPINANNNVALKTAAEGAAVWLNYNDVATEGDWNVIDFVDVRILPEQSVHQTSAGIFNHFKIPADTTYDRIEVRVKGGNGGFAQVKVDNVPPLEDKDVREDGGSGAHIVASFDIGTGPADIPPGSGIGIVVGYAGDDHYEEAICDPICPGRHATGGGGGGSSVIIYRPVPNPDPFPPSGPPWEPYVVAGGGGGAFRALDVGAEGNASSSFTAKGSSAGGSAGPLNCSGGGGGAFHEGTGTVIVDRAGNAGGRTWGSGATADSEGGDGYGGGGSSGFGALSGGGGGGGYKGGDGGQCSLAASGRVGNGGYSYVHTDDVGTYTTTVFDVPSPHTDSASFDAGVVVVIFSITNQAPVADDDAYNATEDTVLNVAAAGGVLNGDADADGDPLTAVKDTNPGNGTVTLNADGSFSYTPDANYCGPDSFTYHANDGAADSNVATVSITVACVNDEPSFTHGGNQSVAEDSGPQSIAAFASASPGGGADEAGQTFSYNVSNSNNALFSAQPAISPAGTLSYTSAPNAFGTATVTVSVTDSGGTANGGDDTSPAQSFDIEVTPVNDAPVATDDSYTVNEDTQLTGSVITDDTGGGADSDVDGDGLSIYSNTDVSHGILALNGDGSFTYDANPDYCGPDGFTYVITDAPPLNGAPLTSNSATVSITVTCVNDPPEVTGVAPIAQTSDYSDDIGSVTITVEDVDDTSTTLLESGEPPLSDTALALSSADCVEVETESPAENGSTCTWTYDGQVLDPGDSVWTIVFTPSDTDGAGTVTGSHELTVQPEDATVTLDGANPVAVEVTEPEGDSGEFRLYFSGVEMQPDLAGIGSPEPGALGKMVPYMELVPVGPGGVEPGVCSFFEPLPNPLDGYGQVAYFECVFDEVPVNTYEVIAWVDGASDTTRYYFGGDNGVLVVFDPSLGFTTGGGWFYWPGTADPDLLSCGEGGYPGDRTNFGYNMKYNKKRTNVQGSLLLQRHTVDANCEGAGKYRAKSNQVDGLSIGDGNDADGDYGWAAFSGKSVFNEPGDEEGEGNHAFLVYVEDHSDEGGDQSPADEFWIEVKDKDGLVVLEVNGPDSDPAGPDEATDGDDTPLHNGTIVVPH